MSVRRNRILLAAFVLLAGSLLLVAAWPTLPAEIGLTSVSGATFEGAENTAEGYQIEWSYSGTASGEPFEISRRMARYPNGSWVGVTRGRFPTSRPPDTPRPVVEASAYRAPDDHAYVRETYAEPVTRESHPEVVREHVLVEGRHVHRFLGPDREPVVGAILPRRLQYARVGTVDRSGERLVKYRVVGRDTAAIPLLSDVSDGTLLATPEGVIRSFDITATADGETTRLRYEASLTPTASLPGWLETARTLPEAPADEAHDVRVVEGVDGLYALVEGEWRPPPGGTVAVLNRSDASAGRLPPARPVLGTDHRRIRLSRDGRLVGAPGEALVERPTEVIVDRNGVNLRRVRVEGPEAFFEADRRVGRLRPAAGGGRTIRLDHVETPANETLPATVTVSNRSREFVVDVPATAHGQDRWFLVRTEAGVEVVPDGRIAPLALPTERPPAATRFPQNASVTVRVAGIPVWRRGVPERLTDANPRPLNASLTGVTIEAYDDPDPEEVHGGPFPGEPYDDHTLLYVHNWGYTEGVTIEGGVRNQRFTCRKDHNCYYRVPDGTNVEIRGNGTTLLEARVDGRTTYAP